jgi:hypothetical protein
MLDPDPDIHNAQKRKMIKGKPNDTEKNLENTMKKVYKKKSLSTGQTEYLHTSKTSYEVKRPR